MSRRALASTGSPRSYLAFDFGTRRVGVATGNALTGTATPLTTLTAQGEARLAAMATLVDTWRPDALVFGLPVHEVDERYTTTDARRSGAADLDAAAAAIILEQHLASVE